MTEREALARLIDPFSQGAPSEDAGEAAGRILAAGWAAPPRHRADVHDALRYLYAEAGIRARALGATDEERLAHAAVRQDIRELAEHFGLELER